jgi:prevent-host-death family protein
MIFTTWEWSLARSPYDSWGSHESIQTLQRQGYDAELLSVDTTTEPYATLKEAIYDGQLFCYYVPKLEEELLGLQYDAKPFSRWIWRFASALPSVQSCDIVRNITTLERTMEKAVSAADANRKFSKLLRTIREGHSYVVTSHGKAVAKIVPVEKNSTLTPGARSALLKRLRSEPIVTIGRWNRDELYEDEL